MTKSDVCNSQNLFIRSRIACSSSGRINIVCLYSTFDEPQVPHDTQILLDSNLTKYFLRIHIRAKSICLPAECNQTVTVSNHHCTGCEKNISHHCPIQERLMHLRIRTLMYRVFASLIWTMSCRTKLPTKFDIGQFNTRKQQNHRSLRNVSWTSYVTGLTRSTPNSAANGDS